ncbi:MAG TPA: DUF4142 domain-containing protein [Casimicrobiaceae bacterium]|nr:DUF4142 domain-containing protein [Casimicrobiaceae bacterium]
MSLPFRKSALAAALLLGLAVGATAQTTQQPSGGTTATPAPPASGSTGMDKGAGSSTSGKAAVPAKTPAKETATSLSGGDRRFMENAARSGMAEIELSRLAADKAQSQQVKDFAKRMIDDHSKAASELRSVASTKNVTLPTDMDGSHQRKRDKLAKMSGNAFDREYMDDMVDDHQKVVRDFRSAAKSAKDPDVKGFAAKTLPALEQHLQMAKAAEDAVKKAPRGGDAKMGTTTGAGTGGGPTGSAPSTATPGKNTAATTGTAGPGTGMPTSSTQVTGTSPQPPGSASDAKMNTQPKK